MGKRIEKLRLKHGLSRGQFGRRVGISGQYLGLVEKGVRGLSVDSIVKICNTMDVSADYLLFGISNPAEVTDAFDGLSYEQIEIVLDIIKKVALFVHSKDGNELLIRDLFYDKAPTLDKISMVGLAKTQNSQQVLTSIT